MARPVVLIHGYSAQGKDFLRWRDLIPSETYHVHVGDYVSLNNEVSIKDIAEGFDLALRDSAHFQLDEDFDAIVHSTGMLVIRCWLQVYPERAKRLKHLIALAPATNGSPLAHKGRGWLGAVFRGNRQVGPDFLEAGDRILEALELGSDFVWNLAEHDLFGAKPAYGPDSDTPYVFTFCGTDDYEGLRKLINEPGTDGTVRWSGCSLNSRKFTLDLTRTNALQRVTLGRTANLEKIPLALVKGVNHSTIVSNPPPALQQQVLAALHVDSAQAYADWCAATERTNGTVEEYQQFVVRVVDERGDPIPDYHVQCFDADGADWDPLSEFDKDVHAFGKDQSLRNFHVKLDARLKGIKRLGLRLTASSGTPLVQYFGYSDGAKRGAQMSATPMAATQVDISFDTALEVAGQRASFFAANTTTFVELKMNREPSLNRVFSFLQASA